MYEDDREEKISQSDAEPLKKVTNQRCFYLAERRDNNDLRLAQISPWCA